MSPLEMVIAYVGASATKSILIGCIILATANLFVDVQIAHIYEAAYQFQQTSLGSRASAFLGYGTAARTRTATFTRDSERSRIINAKLPLLTHPLRGI